MKYGSIIIFTITFFTSCIQNNTDDNAPKLSFISNSKLSIKQGSLNEDSLWVLIHIEDNDGDIGYGSNDPNRDISIRDLRTGIISDQYKLPDLPPSTGQKIDADISLLIFTTCCLFDANIPPCSNPPQFPTDTLIYEIQIRDRANHMSNAVKTTPIILRCE